MPTLTTISTAMFSVPVLSARQAATKNGDLGALAGLLRRTRLVAQSASRAASKRINGSARQSESLGWFDHQLPAQHIHAARERE
ncbi:MAG: hypothetical protein ABI877_03030, partial [Gemmatimonadaceae bacterium]